MHKFSILFITLFGFVSLFHLCYPLFMETIFVAMSGGIDSSFAAYLLKQQGYKVVGITFKLFSDPSSMAIQRAKNRADELSIPHHVIDLRKEFQYHVIDPFVEGYRNGRTPNPCILCNEYIKSSSFITKALEMGGERVATGHYAIIEKIGDEYFIKKGVDQAKDQSYFLYRIQQRLLNLILFPLGRYTKKGIRDSLHSMHWNIDYRGESQDICFIKNHNYRSFLSRFITLKQGPIYSVDGAFMGYHDGIQLYTVGQRKGINIPYKEPLYVIGIIPDDNALIVGTKERLKRDMVYAEALHFFISCTHGTASGKVRYRQKETRCTYAISDGSLKANFQEPISSVTPGQSIVLYKDDIILGGGIISQRFS